jgi:acyl carrier protein
MPDTDQPAGVDTTILDAIRTLLERRGAGQLEVTPTSGLRSDLGLKSLELAELSAALEDDFGRDPFSEGIIPDTVADLLAFYDA